ncbi:MAG: phosphatidate cytidylyltransferase [Candidatus Zixiibacteriota bacterium]
MNNTLTRIVVAVIFIPTILWVSYQGGWWLFGMIFLFTLLAIIEFLVNEGFNQKDFLFWLSLLTVSILFVNGSGDDLRDLVSFDFLSNLQSLSTATVLVAYFLIGGMVLSVNTSEVQVLFNKQSRLLWGVIYVGLLYPNVLLVGRGFASHQGGDFLLFLFGIIWLSDTAAMEIGKRWGKSKLSPSISPNKTVEGFVSGLIAAALTGILIHFWKFPEISIFHLLVISIGCSVFGQLGDLVESMWKRSLNIKDSSSIIPGHGGVLDRFDSLLFAAPFMYAYFKLVLA